MNKRGKKGVVDIDIFSNPAILRDFFVSPLDRRNFDSSCFFHDLNYNSTGLPITVLVFCSPSFVKMPGYSHWATRLCFENKSIFIHICFFNPLLINLRLKLDTCNFEGVKWSKWSLVCQNDWNWICVNQADSKKISQNFRIKQILTDLVLF